MLSPRHCPSLGPVPPPRHCPGRSRYRTRSAAALHAVYSHPALAHALVQPCLHGDSGRGCWSRRKSEQIRRRKTQFYPTCEARQLKLIHDVARKGHLRQALLQCFGQINVDRSCRVIWSIVGVVCPAWSSGVDKECSSQCFDGLFVYSFLGCFEMLSSGCSIFLCSS